MAKVTLAITAAVLEDLRAEHGRELAPAPFLSVLTEAAAESAAMVVCADPPGAGVLEYVIGWCHDCGRPIVHRPHVPRTPIKICLRCFGRRARAIDAR